MHDDVNQQPQGKLFDIAEQQAGYFSAQQAAQAGYSYASQSYHQKQGHWRDEGWGIYRLHYFPESNHEELARLMLWSRNKAGQRQAVVSHDTALRLYDLSDILPVNIHLSVPKAFRKKAPAGVILHKQNLKVSDIRKQDGFWMTTPLRTLLDVADGPLSPEHLKAAVKQALTEGLVVESKLNHAIAISNTRQQERFAFIGFT